MQFDVDRYTAHSQLRLPHSKKKDQMSSLESGVKGERGVRGEGEVGEREGERGVHEDNHNK